MKVQKVKNLLIAIRDENDSGLDTRIKLGESLGSLNLDSGKFFGNMASFDFLQKEYKKYIENVYNVEKHNVFYEVEAKIGRFDLTEQTHHYIPNTSSVIAKYKTLKEAEEFTQHVQLNSFELKYNSQESSHFVCFVNNKRIKETFRKFEKSELFKSDDYDVSDIIDFFEKNNIILYHCEFNNSFELKT